MQYYIILIKFHPLTINTLSLIISPNPSNITSKKNLILKTSNLVHYPPKRILSNQFKNEQIIILPTSSPPSTIFLKKKFSSWKQHLRVPINIFRYLSPIIRFFWVSDRKLDCKNPPLAEDV